MNKTLADWRSGALAAAVSAVIGGVAGAFVLGPQGIAPSAFLAGTMGAIALEDMRRMRVPDAWNLPAALGGFVAAVVLAKTTGSTPLLAFGHAVVSLIVCGGIFYLLRQAFFRARGVEGLGLGDVKLAATGGIWTGWEISPAVVLLAALGAIAWVIVAALARRGWPKGQKIPFGAFLAPAIWICWIYARALTA